MMNIVYSDSSPIFDEKKPSVFLVGPTPRSLDVPSWRPEAIQILRDLEFDGAIFVPERSNWEANQSYYNQVEWEYFCLSKATHIVAWVPRCMQTMPALTTNVEFGYWLASTPERFFYGRPKDAPHTDYLDWMYEKITKRWPTKDLKTLLQTALEEHLWKKQ